MGSVRVRITLVSTVLIAVVLTVAAVAMLQAVEAQLEQRAERALDEAEEASDEAYRTIFIDGEEFTLGVFQPDEDDPADEIYGELEGPDGELVYELVIERESEDLIEVIDADDDPVTDGDVFDFLQESIFSVESRDGEFFVIADELDEVRESLEVVRGTLWIAIPVLTGLFSLLTYVLVGRALRPVHAITAEVESISAAELDRRVPVPSANDEVSELATVMNSMLDRVESGAKRQREFSADASHELRSPLTSIRTAAELLGRRPESDRVERLAEDVVIETDRMDALIDDLLTLARSEQTALVSPEHVSLTELAAEVVDAAPLDQVSFNSTGDVLVHGDPSQLRRVIQNLLDNAVRHATQRVVVTVGPTSVLCVEDDGPGIPIDERERVFDRFARIDGARARTAGGTGLGLALVAAIVDRHGGTIEVDDSPELGGARFTVALSRP